MPQNVNIGVPQQIDLTVQMNVDVTQYVQLYNGKDILGSWDAGGGVIGLTVTAHGLSTGNTVVVDGHALNINANGTWAIIVLDADRYTLTGSTWLTNGSTTGQAGTRTDLTGYTLTAFCKTSLGASGEVFAITATKSNTTPEDGLLGLTFIAATTAAASAGKYVWYCRGAKTGANRYFAKGALSLDLIAT